MKHRPQPDRDAEADLDALSRAAAALTRPEDVRAFLEDLCTPAELEAMADRWKVVPLLAEGVPYREIHERTLVSVTTIGRVARTLEQRHRRLRRRHPAPPATPRRRAPLKEYRHETSTPRAARDRLRIAIQKSGRLSEPALALLAASGLSWQESRDKLFYYGESLPVDLLLVRDDDIPGLIADGVCDLGMVGRNVLKEQAYERERAARRRPSANGARSASAAAG